MNCNTFCCLYFSDNDTDFDAAEDPESGPKYDVALRYLVLESISAFNRCQKKIQFFVDSGGLLIDYFLLKDCIFSSSSQYHFKYSDIYL